MSTIYKSKNWITAVSTLGGGGGGGFGKMFKQLPTSYWPVLYISLLVDQYWNLSMLYISSVEVKLTDLLNELNISVFYLRFLIWCFPRLNRRPVSPNQWCRSKSIDSNVKGTKKWRQTTVSVDCDECKWLKYWTLGKNKDKITQIDEGWTYFGAVVQWKRFVKVLLLVKPNLSL